MHCSKVYCFSYLTYGILIFSFQLDYFHYHLHVIHQRVLFLVTIDKINISSCHWLPKQVVMNVKIFTGSETQLVMCNEFDATSSVSIFSHPELWVCQRNLCRCRLMSDIGVL